MEEIRLGDRDGHTFELLSQDETLPFITDTNLLHHILTNLLSNAARYSPTGTRITVRLETAVAGLQIMVEDQGIGIPTEDLGRIFMPFERGPNVGQIKGTGLGLNIVKRMTEMLGGTLRVESAAGVGSHFTVILPHLSLAAEAS